MNVLAIVQARMGSTRLPAKILADVVGVPLIVRILDRVQAARSVTGIVVATTTDPEDDELERFLKRSGKCDVFRGSRDDVLDRFYQCAVSRQPDVIVRVTADDPFKDPSVIDLAVSQLLQDPTLDYCSNTLEPTYPEGLDIEVFRFATLEKAHREAKLPSEREHVTPYVWKHPGRFRVRNFRHDPDLSSWRWTVDKPEDLEFARRVYSHFAGQPLVSYVDIIAWLNGHPEVRAINAKTVRNEGYLKSLQNEQKQ